MDKAVYSTIIEKLEEDLPILTEQCYQIFCQIEQATSLCKMAYLDLQKLVVQNNFQNINEEIYFFREIKPKVCSKLTFYRKLATIESKRPKARQFQIEFLQKEIYKLHGFFEDHSDFIVYYRSGQTFNDDKYFTRNVDALILGNHNYEYLVNPDFSTAYDFTLSKILAYEQLEKYLDNEIRKLERMDDILLNAKPRNKWTKKLSALAELIYALKAVGAIDNGNSSIKELVELFSRIFDIPEGNIYNAFRSVYSRKTKELIFIDQMREAMIQRIDEQFE
jgi:hypothetical protein